MATKQPEILDLDKVTPAKRIVKLAGRDIDVSVIPSEVTLELVTKMEDLDTDSPETLPMVLDMVVKICNVQAKEQDQITAEWLVKKTSLEQLMSLLEFVMRPIRERAEANGKNKARPNNKE